MVEVCLAYPYIAGILTHVGTLFFSYSQRFCLDIPCVFPRITPMSPSYALALFPQEEPAPRLSLSPTHVSFVHRFSHNHFVDRQPSLNLFWSSPVGNLLDLFRFGKFLLGFALFVPIRLFPRGSCPINRRHLTRY